MIGSQIWPNTIEGKSLDEFWNKEVLNIFSERNMKVVEIVREKEFIFPCIMENPMNSIIIIATGFATESKQNYSGICLKAGETNHNIGYEKYWSTKAFKKFKGKLTIEQ